MNVSIITPSFNSAKTIKDTLESVKNQTYSHIEHIIIDGNSTDNTLDIIKNYPHIVKCISETDQGIYDAMNKGISIATGEIIAILNSDDFYNTQQTIEKVVNTFKSKLPLSVYGDLNYVERFNTDKVVRKWKSGNIKQSKFIFGWMPPHPALFIKKEVYDRYGVFDTTFGCAADYELMLRFLYRNKINSIYIPEVLVKMRTGGVTNSSLIYILKSILEINKAWKVNNLRPFIFTPLLKPLRKIFQIF